MLAVGPLHAGFVLAEENLALVTENELYAQQARLRKERAGAAPAEGMLRDLSEVKIGDPGRARAARHRPLPWARHHESRRGRGGVPHARIRRQRQALRPGFQPAPHRALQRRAGGGRAAAPARQRPMGESAAQGGGAGARHRRGAPQSLRAARAAQGPRVQAAPPRLRRLPRGLPVRGDARPGCRGRRRARGSQVGQAHGPPDLRRRRLRQDRGGPARGLRRRVRRQAGRRAGADHAARRAAFQHVLGPLRGMAGQGGRAVALPHGQGAGRGARGARRRTASTSRSARTSSSRATCGSRTWGSSSWTRSIASACARRSA